MTDNKAALDALDRLVKALSDAHRRHPIMNVEDANIVRQALTIQPAQQVWGIPEGYALLPIEWPEEMHREIGYALSLPAPANRYEKLVALFSGRAATQPQVPQEVLDALTHGLVAEERMIISMSHWDAYKDNSDEFIANCRKASPYRKAPALLAQNRKE